MEILTSNIAIFVLEREGVLVSTPHNRLTSESAEGYLVNINFKWSRPMSIKPLASEDGDHRIYGTAGFERPALRFITIRPILVTGNFIRQW
jgi:hypothetical protein